MPLGASPAGSPATPLEARLGERDQHATRATGQFKNRRATSVGIVQIERDISERSRGNIVIVILSVIDILRHGSPLPQQLTPNAPPVRGAALTETIRIQSKPQAGPCPPAAGLLGSIALTGRSEERRVGKVW